MRFFVCAHFYKFVSILMFLVPQNVPHDPICSPRQNQGGDYCAYLHLMSLNDTN